MSSTILAIWNVILILGVIFSPGIIALYFCISHYKEKRRSWIILLIISCLLLAVSGFVTWQIVDFIMSW